MKTFFLTIYCCLLIMCVCANEEIRVCPRFSITRVSREDDLQMQIILIEQGLDAAKSEMKKNNIDTIESYSTQTHYIMALSGDVRLQERINYKKLEYVQMLVKIAYGDPPLEFYWGTRMKDMPYVLKVFWSKLIFMFYDADIVETLD